MVAPGERFRCTEFCVRACTLAVQIHPSLLDESSRRALRRRELECDKRVEKCRRLRHLGEWDFFAESLENRLAQSRWVCLSEQHLRYFLGDARGFGTVHSTSHVACQRLLGAALLRRRLDQLVERIDLLAR